MKYRSSLLALVAAHAFSCVGSDPSLLKSGEEEAAPVDGAFDSFRAPTDLGTLRLGETVRAELSRDARFLAWTFELTDDATVTLATGDAGAGEVDTVAYLYREGARGWGRYVARNDDVDGTLFSRITEELGVGRYRILVKGYSSRTFGAFSLASSCDGPGCPVSIEPSACLFGAELSDLESRVRVTNRQTLDAAWPFIDSQRAQIVTAVQQSAHTDVVTVEEAFARVDGGVIESWWLLDEAGARSFVAYSYGAGDNVYGAIFFGQSTALVASIRDGFFEGCTVRAQTCALGGSYRALLDSTAFEAVLSTTIRDASSLTPSRAVQLTRAAQVAYDEVTTAAEALATVDEGLVNLTQLQHRATGRIVTAYEYGAGDNSSGAVFLGDTTELVASITDGDIYDCAFFDEGTPGTGAGVGADCNETTVCAEGLRCEGFVAEVGFGKCAPTTRLPNDGMACSSDAVCGEGLVCAGVTSGYGLCNPQWMRGSFSEGTSVAIPDGDPAGVSRTLYAYGLATVSTDVEVRALIRHEFPGDLRVTLTNPSGTEVVLFDGERDEWETTDIELDGPVRGFPGDESVNGAWVLRIVDRAARDVGTLERWALDLTSRWD
jgi:subtilisin-like proprotein convertase family protein